MKNLLLVMLTLMLASLAPARAAEQLVGGLLLVVSDPLPGTPSQRHIKISARDPRGATVVGNPLADGCTLRVIVNGATSSSQTLAIPPGAFQEPDGPGWTQVIKRRRTYYSYVDERGENGPVTVLSIRQQAHRLSISATLDGRGDHADIDVVPPNPGTDGGMILSINGGDTYCVAFGGAARGKITDNDATLFRVVKPRVRACPAVIGSSAIAAFIDMTIPE